jgi:serine acetyltransferase
MVLFGRSKEVARILALIRSTRESAMAVTGNHGAGKTSLLGGGVRVGRGAHPGMNSSLPGRTSIGSYATIGMEAAIPRDLPERETWVGAPARAVDRQDRNGVFA